MLENKVITVLVEWADYYWPKSTSTELFTSMQRFIRLDLWTSPTSGYADYSWPHLITAISSKTQHAPFRRQISYYLEANVSFFNINYIFKVAVLCCLLLKAIFMSSKRGSSVACRLCSHVYFHLPAFLHPSNQVNFLLQVFPSNSHQ